MKKTNSFLIEALKTVILAALIVAPIRVFIFQPFLVRGASMEPNYYQGDYLIVDQLTYRFREPERGEVVVFDSPQGIGRRYIKRIIGLPGENLILEDGIIKITEGDTEKILDEFSYLDEETEGSFEFSLEKDDYFLLGDNRANSMDSRAWGAVQKEDIIGKVRFQFSPFSVLAD